MAPLLATNQAKTVAVLSVITWLLALGASIKAQNIGMAFGTLIIGALALLLTTYSVGCWVSGGCGVWSWINVVLIGIILLSMIIGLIKYLVTPKPPQVDVSVQQQPQGNNTTTLPSVSEYLQQRAVPAPTLAPL